MTAKRLLIIGGAILAVATVLGTVVPAVGYQFSIMTFNDQASYLVMGALSDLIRVALPPIATAFLGAGLVVLYLERRDSAG